MTFNGLINAEYDFSAIGDWVKSIFDHVAASATISDIWAAVTAFFSVVPAVLVSSLFLVLSLVEVFFGKRLLGLQKFLGCFAVGFAVSAAYLPDVLPESIAVSPLIVGLVVGIVAALLCKLVYNLAYIAAVGLGVYVMCMGGYVLPEAVSGFTKGNMMISLVVVVVAVIVALILRKLIEMAGTATLGGFLAWLCIEDIVYELGFTPTEHSAAVFKLAVIIVLAVLGLLVQFKTRKRKW